MSKKKKRKSKPIDKVTVGLVRSAFGVLGYQLENDFIDKFIDVIELLEDKGGSTSLKDLAKLEVLWKEDEIKQQK